MNVRDSLTPVPVTPTVIHRTDYRPPSHRILSVKLDFTLGLELTRVTNEFVFERVGSDSSLHLHGDELKLINVAIDDRVLKENEYDCSSQHLLIHTAPEKGQIRIETEINPTANTALMGLYASRGGLFTQCESEGFRRITYFLDRPDVMATYDVVMRGPKAQFPVLLSNGNLVDETDLGGGMHQAHWQDPFPKPSYLFALVAADLDRIEETITTASGKNALLQVYTRKEDLSQAGFALQSLKRAIFWDEKRYGLELDLERFMIVAVPDFNSGAMENKGLNLFNTKYVLADPQTATDADHDGIESVVAHEYFHNWTGNRITCRDWFQLTLKEGLTVFRDSEFSADMAAEGLSPAEAASARAVRRIESVRVLRSAQFPEDAGPMSHPIRPASYQEIRNFYTATVYEKGAEVIRMLPTLLRIDGFRKGMDLYFARHDGQAVTCENFVSAMFDANSQVAPNGDDDSRELATQFMRWYDTSGTPRAEVSDNWGNGLYSMKLTQRIATNSPSQKPLIVPIRLGFLDPRGQEVDLAGIKISQGGELKGDCLILKDWSAEVSVETSEPLVPSILRDFSSPVALEYPYSVGQLLHLLAHDQDPFNRWEAGQRLMLTAMLTPEKIEVERLGSALHKVLTEPRLDNGYKALMLTLPSELYISEQVNEIDPAAIRQARDSLRSELTRILQGELIETDRRLGASSGTAYSPDPISAGRRSLANLAQSWLALAGVIPPRKVLERFSSATNMTDRFAALTVLVELDCSETITALQKYLDRFQDHPLALDKWFSVQVTVPNQTALARVRELMLDPQFDVSNPNRVRSVFGAFFHQNLPGFHREDGAGYELWSETVITIDRRNSQLASRMARAMDRWAKFEPKRRSAMKAALERIVAEEQLSSDVREVVSKVLAS